MTALLTIILAGVCTGVGLTVAGVVVGAHRVVHNLGRLLVWRRPDR